MSCCPWVDPHRGDTLILGVDHPMTFCPLYECVGAGRSMWAEPHSPSQRRRCLSSSCSKHCKRPWHSKTHPQGGKHTSLAICMPMNQIILFFSLHFLRPTFLPPFPHLSSVTPCRHISTDSCLQCTNAGLAAAHMGYPSHCLFVTTGARLQSW